MNIREAARKAGGEEAVKEIDRGIAIQNVIEKDIKAAIAKALEENKDNEVIVRVAAAEALSTSYGEAVARLGKTKDMSNTEMMILAIRSVNGSVNRGFENVNAEGIGDLIKAAAKKASAQGE